MSMARAFCFLWPRCSWGLRCFGSHRKHGLHAANWRNSDQGLSAMETIRFTASSLPLMARMTNSFTKSHARHRSTQPSSQQQSLKSVCENFAELRPKGGSFAASLPRAEETFGIKELPLLLSHANDVTEPPRREPRSSVMKH